MLRYHNPSPAFSVLRLSQLATDIKNRTFSSPSVYIFLFDLYFTIVHVRAHSFNIVLSLFCEQHQIICVQQLCSAAIYRNLKFASRMESHTLFFGHIFSA